jgi:uncharacterized protein (DUF2147 family)
MISPTLFIILAATFPAPAQVDADAIVGQWYTEKCLAIFEFFRCGNDYRARMIALTKPAMVDSNNPVDSLRTRKVNGIVAVHGLIYNADKRQWVNGRVYNPEDGRTYSCYCTLKDDGKKLYFRGFIGVSVLGGSQVWTRECGK